MVLLRSVFCFCFIAVLATSVTGSRRQRDPSHSGHPLQGPHIFPHQEENAPLPPGFQEGPREAVEPQAPAEEEKKGSDSSSSSDSEDAVRPHRPRPPHRPHHGPRPVDHDVHHHHDHRGHHHPHFIRFGLHGVPIYRRHRHRHSHHRHHHHDHDHKHGHSSTQVPSSTGPIQSSPLPPAVTSAFPAESTPLSYDRTSDRPPITASPVRTEGPTSVQSTVADASTTARQTSPEEPSTPEVPTTQASATSPEHVVVVDAKKAETAKCNVESALQACEPLRLSAANRTGPAAGCSALGEKYLVERFESCFKNFCDNKKAVCEDLNGLIKTCRKLSDDTAVADWVKSVGCAEQALCPSHATFVECVPCQHTCLTVDPRLGFNCSNACHPGCKCDEGFVHDYTKRFLTCVPASTCPCKDAHGVEHPPYVQWLTNNCQKSSVCINGVYTERPFRCGNWQRCDVEKGTETCVVKDRSVEDAPRSSAAPPKPTEGAPHSSAAPPRPTDGAPRSSPIPEGGEPAVPALGVAQPANAALQTSAAPQETQGPPGGSSTAPEVQADPQSIAKPALENEESLTVAEIARRQGQDIPQ